MSALLRRIALPVFLTLCLSAAGMSFCLVAQGQKKVASSGRKISLNLRNASLAATLKNLFHAAKVDYRIEPDVLKFTEGENCSLNLRAVSFKEGLDQILGTYGSNIWIGFRVEHNRYIIETQRVTLNAKNSLLRGEIADLLHSSNTDFVYDRNVFGTARVTISAKDVSIVQAINILLAQVPALKLQCGVVHRAIVIKPRAKMPIALQDKKLCLRLQTIRLQDAVETIFIACGYDYITRRGDNEAVSEEASDIPVKDILKETLLQANKPITYMSDNDIIRIVTQVVSPD